MITDNTAGNASLDWLLRISAARRRAPDRATMSSGLATGTAGLDRLSRISAAPAEPLTGPR
jgi:hypothetical protein